MAKSKRVRKPGPFKFKPSGAWPAWEMLSNQPYGILDRFSPTTAVECRRLAAWLLKCAAWMEQEKKRG